MERVTDLDTALGLDGLRDPDAALGCVCSCHLRRFGRPTHLRPDGTSVYDRLDSGPLHDDGRTCPCQQTPAEREAAREQLFATLAEISDRQAASGHTAAADRDRQTAAAVAAAGGIDGFDLHSSWVPLAFSGSYDGQYLYFRSRHGVWRLEVDDVKPDGAGTVVAVGADDDHLPDDGWVRSGTDGPVTCAVRLVLDVLDRRRRAAGCDHPGGGVFCPACGQRLVSPAPPK